MHKLIHIIKKDFLLLIRDKLGLITLFILPTFLILTVSAIDAGRDNARKNIKLLLISNGTDQTSTGIEKALRKSNEFKITKYRASVALAKQRVNEGKYSGIIYIPWQTDQTKPYQVDIYLDPGLDQSIKDSIGFSIDYILQKVTLEKANYILGKIKAKLVQDEIELKTGSTSETEKEVTVAAQNVPAWSIFGMFFIVISLAGQMVHEKLDGVSQRLRLMPVPGYLLLFGKTFTFVILNMIQLALMLSIGIFVLPYFDTPALDISGKVDLVLIVGLFTSIAAIGFGLFMGTISKSLHQVNAVCPFLIVIMAAVSGIFTPVSIMPERFKLLGQFSPLYWAQDSFVDIFARSADLTTLQPNLARLLGFYILMMILIKIIKVLRHE